MNFAVIGLNHGHIYAQAEGLLNAGGICTGVFAEETDLVEGFHKKWPEIPLRTKKDLLNDKSIDLIASASINLDRGPLAVESLRHGKHFFVDKPPLTHMQDVEAIREALASSGKLLFVFYGERLNPLDVKAKELVDQGKIGNLVHVMGLGPHRLSWAGRPQWMWNNEQYGGILNDIASHQVDWFCWITGQKIRDFKSRIGSFGACPKPNFDDFGDAMVTGQNGVTGYLRVDWFTPEKSPIWGDIRGLVIGTTGTIELRRTINIGAKDESDRGAHMILINQDGGPIRVDVSNVKVDWPEKIMQSIRDNKNYQNPHDMLLHVMEMTVRIQTEAQRVR